MFSFLINRTWQKWLSQLWISPSLSAFSVSEHGHQEKQRKVQTPQAREKPCGSVSLKDKEQVWEGRVTSRTKVSPSTSNIDPEDEWRRQGCGLKAATAGIRSADSWPEVCAVGVVGVQQRITDNWKASHAPRTVPTRWCPIAYTWRPALCACPCDCACGPCSPSSMFSSRPCRSGLCVPRCSGTSHVLTPIPWVHSTPVLHPNNFLHLGFLCTVTPTKCIVSAGVEPHLTLTPRPAVFPLGRHHRHTHTQCN